MSTLQAIPTQHGIGILNSELKNTVTKYRLIGALTHDAPSESLYSFYENTIETSYYDDNGVLTFILNLPIEQHFDEYLHQIHVLDSSNQSVIECSTPKVALPKGIGGMVTLKAAISGEAGQVIFKHSEFVTETELNDQYLIPLQSKLKKLPLYPEIVNDDNRLAISLDGTTLTIADNQIIRLYGWKDLNTQDIENKSFTIELSKTYHLRFTESNGFVLHDVDDVQYNPDGVDEADYRFDTKYDDALIALISEGVLMRCIHTNVLSKTVHLNGSGVLTIPTCPRLRTIRLLRADPELNYDGQIQKMSIAGVPTTKSSYCYAIGQSASVHWGHDNGGDQLILDSNNHGQDKTLSTSILMLSRKMGIFMFYSSHAEIDYTSDAHKEFLNVQATGYTPSAWKDGEISVNYSNLNIAQFTVEYVR